MARVRGGGSIGRARGHWAGAAARDAMGHGGTGGGLGGAPWQRARSRAINGNRTLQEIFLVIPADGQFAFAGQHRLFGEGLDGIDIDRIGAVDTDQPVEEQPVEQLAEGKPQHEFPVTGMEADMVSVGLYEQDIGEGTLTNW
jgi:hypothetical protein